MMFIDHAVLADAIDVDYFSLPPATPSPRFQFHTPRRCRHFRQAFRRCHYLRFHGCLLIFFRFHYADHFLPGFQPSR
jgi:hypothetical protein